VSTSPTSPATPEIIENPRLVAKCSKSALKAPQIRVCTPFVCKSNKRSQGVSSGAQSSSASLPSGAAGKISIWEHQFNTGATRPRMTGIAIISSRLRIFESYGFWQHFKAQCVPTLLWRRFSISRLQSGGKMHPMIQARELGMEIRRGLP
jgi:hypothetical protein